MSHIGEDNHAESHIYESVADNTALLATAVAAAQSVSTSDEGLALSDDEQRHSSGSSLTYRGVPVFVAGQQVRS